MVVGPLTSFRRLAPEASEIGNWPTAVVRSCLDCALAERERWALWIPVGFGAGIGIYFSLSAEPSAWIAVAMGIASIGCAIGSIYSTRTGLSAALAMLAALSLGFGYAKRDGDRRDSDAAVATRKNGVSCDGYGCIAKGRDGTLIAAVSRIDALAEDCANAAIVISAVPASRHCKGPKLLIDKFDVARADGYAVWLGKSVRVETVEGGRGQRPWSQKPRAPRNRSQYRRMRPTSLP